MNDLPPKIAIAGAWGYIGRKFVDASLALGLETYVYDIAETPDDIDPKAVIRVADGDEFYHLEADVFHLALHPEHRGKAQEILLERSARERMLILCEKPMAQPENPDECSRIVGAFGASDTVMLYDFPELFDPMTRRITEFLRGFDKVEVTDVFIQRSKDRESPDNPRNYKKMVHIQYQETVHCIAFVLYLLGKTKGALEAVLADGFSVTASAEPYDPPNPEIYPYVVDGKCDFELSIGNLHIVNHTDFKKGAEFKKQRIIKGLADKKPFTLEVNFLENGKHLVIDGVKQNFDPGANSYESVISTLWNWYKKVDRHELMHGLYPNPPFAWMTYQLSSAIWKSSWDRREINLSSPNELRRFDAGFAATVDQFPRYPL